MQRTLERELNVPKTVVGEAPDACVWVERVSYCRRWKGSGVG